MNKSLETHQWRRWGLKYAYSMTLVYWALPDNTPQIAPPSTHTSALVFSWRWYGRWWLGPFQGVTSFPWVSPMYIRDIHVIKLMFFSCYSVFDLGWGSLSEEPRRVKENYFSCPTVWWLTMGPVQKPYLLGGLQIGSWKTGRSRRRIRILTISSPESHCSARLRGEGKNFYLSLPFQI